MIRPGSSEWKRRRMIHRFMFFGLILCMLYSATLEMSGRFVANASIVIGVVLIVTGLVLIVRDRAKKLEHLRVEPL